MTSVCGACSRAADLQNDRSPQLSLRASVMESNVLRGRDGGSLGKKQPPGSYCFRRWPMDVRAAVW